MRRIFSTVTRKMVIGYLVIVFFSLLAIGFALFRMDQQAQQAQQLVKVDFHIFDLLRDLQQNLAAQDNIDKQLLILRDPEFEELRENRSEELGQLLQALSQVSLPEAMKNLPTQIENYRAINARLASALDKEDWDRVQELADDLIVPVRGQILEVLGGMRQEQQHRINDGLSQLHAKTSEAYQLTLFIALIGLGLSLPVGLKVFFSIGQSVKTLKEATKEISAGSFEHKPPLRGQDEFAQLAREFVRMGRKLRELEQLQLDANPLTRLPGNLAIDRELDQRINNQLPFSHLYIDLDNFKAYSDRYGYKAGSDVLAQVGQLIEQVAQEYGCEGDLIGHIGGDDYVVITSLEKGELIAQQIIQAFKRQVPEFYNREDREAGLFVGKDRYGIERSFPLMTMSIALIRSDYLKNPSRLEISQDCARLKDFLKGQEGSNYLVDRRK